MIVRVHEKLCWIAENETTGRSSYEYDLCAVKTSGASDRDSSQRIVEEVIVERGVDFE